jgi:D-arabinan endo alpha-(1,5)-arabinofuranosidase
MGLQVGIALWLVLTPALGWAATPSRQAATPEGGPRLGELREVAVLTGPDSINETHTRWGVDGTDLGHTFEHQGAIYMVFGDTFGPAKSDWRSNVAAVITDDDPSDGLTFDRMIEDLPGHAQALIKPSMVEGTEVTIIPTYGVSLGERMVLHYMAVREWGPPGRWDLNSSGLAYSDDGGQTWIVDPAATWPGDSNFGQVAMVPLDVFVYLFGIPGGRFGGVQLARVDAERMLDMDAYAYWDGAAWVANDREAAQTILPAPVGELSVRWNAHYGKWLMMYLNEDKYAVVLRTADCLTGPWSEELTVATGAEYPQLYAPFMPPKWNDGPEIYFTMSLFGPYNVSLMQTSLAGVEPSSGAAECAGPA